MSIQEHKKSQTINQRKLECRNIAARFLENANARRLQQEIANLIYELTKEEIE